MNNQDMQSQNKLSKMKQFQNKISSRKQLSVFLLFFIPICICYLTESFTHNPFKTMSFPAQILNIIFFELFMMVLFCLTGKGKIALWIESILFTIIGLANYFVISFRGIPVLPLDILSIRTAASVADNYHYTLTPRGIFVFLAFLLLDVAIFFCDTSVTCLRKQVADTDRQVTGNFPLKRRLSGTFLFMVLMVFFLYYVGSEDASSRFLLNDKLYSPTVMSYENGTVIAFDMQVQHMTVEKPVDYSPQQAVDILEAYTTGEEALTDASANNSSKPTAYKSTGISTEETPTSSVNASTEDAPNIIVVMNEAFSDLNLLGNVPTNEDYIPFVRSMLKGQENTWSGYLHSSVLGGNTANSEFEFLTGNTMAFLPHGSIPYQQYVKKETDSLASHLKSLGYTSIAFHPFYATGWHRDEVYPLLGFETFLTMDDVSNPTLVRKYVSDQSDYEKIIELYETKQSEPLFLFNVTMQNHSSYDDDFDNFLPAITMEGGSPALNRYLSLLKISDEETRKLVEYFSQKEEKTILVFFGDHQPTDSVVSDIWLQNNKNGENLSALDRQLRYQVPFFIWANYDIGTKTGLESSINYLGLWVMEAANLPLSPYFQFLQELRQEYPVITPIQTKNKLGESFETKTQKEALHSYAVLQYDQLFSQNP